MVRNWTAINMIITLGELCVYNAWSDMQRSRTEGSVCWLFWVRWGRYWTCCVNGVLVEVSMSLLVCWYMDVLFLYIMKCRAVKVDEHNYYLPSLKLTARTWTWAFPSSERLVFQAPFFQVRNSHMLVSNLVCQIATCFPVDVWPPPTSQQMMVKSISKFCLERQEARSGILAR